MTKTKKKNFHLPLVVTGYALFSLLLVATLLSSTIPLTTMLFDPRVLRLNVTVILIAFTIGSLLPLLLGYIIGDHSIKTKSKLSHHFTGVMFGLLAYWVMLLTTVFVAVPSEFYDAHRNTGIIIVNILPSIGVAIVTAILAVAHMRSRHAKEEIISYRPFATVLIAAIVGLPLLVLIQNVVLNTVNVFSFVPLVLLIIFGCISYISLRKVKLNIYNKVVWTAVGVSVLLVATYIVQQFSSALLSYVIRRPMPETYQVEMVVSLAATLLLWAVYWFKQVKALR